jgi:hypothetical protein
VQWSTQAIEDGAEMKAAMQWLARAIEDGADESSHAVVSAGH